MSGPRVPSPFALAVALRHAREGVDGGAAHYLRAVAARLRAGRPLPVEVAEEIAALLDRVAESGRARAALGVTGRRRRPLDLGDTFKALKHARRVDDLQASGLSRSKAVEKVAEETGGAGGGHVSTGWRRLKRAGG